MHAALHVGVQPLEDRQCVEKLTDGLDHQAQRSVVMLPAGMRRTRLAAPTSFSRTTSGSISATATARRRCSAEARSRGAMHYKFLHGERAGRLPTCLVFHRLT